jgi:hypothetical protein
MARVLRDVDRSTERSVFSTDTPGSPELWEATQDLLREEAVDLTQRIDQLDVVLAFDEVEWVRGITADEDSDRTSQRPLRVSARLRWRWAGRQAHQQLISD